MGSGQPGPERVCLVSVALQHLLMSGYTVFASSAVRPSVAADAWWQSSSTLPDCLKLVGLSQFPRKTQDATSKLLLSGCHSSQGEKDIIGSGEISPSGQIQEYSESWRPFSHVKVLSWIRPHSPGNGDCSKQFSSTWIMWTQRGLERLCVVKPK